MKFGIRTPSLRKSIAARTSIKRVARHNLGLKVPNGYGWFTNPKKALYNRIYNRTSFSIFTGGSIFKWFLTSRSNYTESKIIPNSLSDQEVRTFDPIIFLLNIGAFVILFIWIYGVNDNISHFYNISSYWIQSGKQNAIYNGYILTFFITVFSLILGRQVYWINIFLYSYILYRSLIYFPSIIVTVFISYFIVSSLILKLNISFSSSTHKFQVKEIELENKKEEYSNKKDIVDTFIDNTFQRIYDKQEENIMKNIRNRNK